MKLIIKDSTWEAYGNKPLNEIVGISTYLLSNKQTITVSERIHDNLPIDSEVEVEGNKITKVIKRAKIK